MNKIRLDNKDFYYQVFYKNIKNLNLKIKPDNQLIVSCSPRISKKMIEDFILRNESAILKKAGVISKRISLYDRETMLLFGETLDVSYEVNANKNGYEFHEEAIHIHFKHNYFDTYYMEHIYKELLLDELKQILKRIAPMIESEIDLNDIVYKTQLMKTQFGSCIPKKRIIKLNSILARFPKRYLEAILIHEIIHLKVHNHQKDFYRYVNRWIPNYRTLKQELNKLSGKYVI